MSENMPRALQKIEIGMQQAFSDYFIDTSTEIERDAAIHAFTISVRGFLYGEEAYREIVKYPRDWFNAFKERWFPKLLLRFYPVRYTTKTFTVDCVYPKFNPLRDPHTYLARIIDE